MAKCPFCKANLKRSKTPPKKCPKCGRSLAAADADQMHTGDRKQPSRPEAVASMGSGEMQSDEIGLPPGMDSSEDHLANTVQSDEFTSDDVAAVNSGTGTSEGQPTGSAEFDVALVGPTMQSEEFTSSGAAGGESVVTAGSDEYQGSPVDVTARSDEFTSSGELAGGASKSKGGFPDPFRTAGSDEFPQGDMDRTVQSDEFTSSEAAAAGQQGPGNEKTIMSGDGIGPIGEDTMVSAEIAQDEVKTMQTMWSGAFQAPTNPSMTIKGESKGPETPPSSLVIKQRQLSSPGEQPARTGDAEYELIRVLGEGGMGVVYDARQTSVDRSVAVKMLKPRTSSDERQRQKFLAEAVVTGDLDHPNIVPIYDVGTSERGLLFYAMKRVKGTPWMKLLPQKSQTENIEILMKVADAVGFAHARGVVHRDLKPENVMLGDFGEVLVMDWGLALPAPGYSKNSTITAAHSMGGTPAYMAPEMASGPLEKISFASDVYLLGAILYEVLTGRPPHSGKNTMQCLFAAAKNEIRPTEKTGELIDIARKAMATDPKNRYETVRAFQDAIRDYQSHTESIVLSTRAVEELEKAQKSNDYKDYSRSQFAFEEALVLWDGNARARTGLADAQLKYAQCALTKGDYDLGVSLLDPANAEHGPVLTKLKAAQKERDAKQQRFQMMKRIAAVAVVAFIGVVTVSYFAIRKERDFANEQKDLAEAAEEVAKEQKDLAVKAEQEATDQRDKAVAAKEMEEAAKRVAVAEKERADQARTVAVAAEKTARDAEKVASDERDKALIAKAAEQKAREKQEYEAYVARIGLAAAKIDENAFVSARALLDGCPPELRNWEWGRLMYLCGQSDRTIDAKTRLEAVAFSPDGSKFVSGSWNRSADIWDTKTGSHLRAIPHGGSRVYAVAYSPTESLIATGSNDPEAYLRIVNAETSETVTRCAGHNKAVLSVAFSKDGKRLLSTSYDNTVRLWEVASGKELRTFEGHNWWVWSAAFSPDEKSIISASQDGSAIVWNTDTGEQKGQFLGHKGPVFAAAYSSDGRVATAGYDKRILVWNPTQLKAFDFRKLAEGQQVELPPMVALDGHGAGVRSVSFSRDGELVVSGSHDNTVKVWSSTTGRSLYTFRGHGEWVRACALAPDEKRILSVSYDQNARLWSITDYEEVRVLQGRMLERGTSHEAHDDAILGAAFSRDGKSIVTASRDRSARTWNPSTGREIRTFEEGHTFLASNAAFFPDGRRLVTSAVDNTTRFWDVESGSEKGRFERTGRSAALALSHHSRWLLTGSDEKTAKLWNTETQELVRTLRGHNFEVTAVAFSPDDALLFTGDANGAGMLWNAASGDLKQKLEGHTRKITAAAFLADGSRLLTASNDKTVSQWDVAAGREQSALALKHPEAVLSLSILPNARQALTNCADGEVRLWDLDSARVVSKLPVKGLINAVAVTSDGRRALTTGLEMETSEGAKIKDGLLTVRLWDLQTGREILAPQRGGKLGPFLEFDPRRRQLWTAIFSPANDAILTVGGSDARLWDMQSSEERMSFSRNGIVASAAFSPDARHIVTGCWDNSARIWNVETGKSEKKLSEAHTGLINSAVYSPDGKTILTASDDMTAIMWDADTGAAGKKLKGHTKGVHAAVFSPDGKWVVTASDDKTARLWNASSGEMVREFVGHGYGLLSIAFSTDGKRIITGSDDSTARVWDVQTGETLQILAGHTAAVSSVAFLPDDRGSRVITGSSDYSAKLWDAVTGKEILTLKGHSQEVTCVNASATGRYLLTGSRDGTALVWLASQWPEEAKVAEAGNTAAQRSDERKVAQP